MTFHLAASIKSFLDKIYELSKTFDAIEKKIRSFSMMSNLVMPTFEQTHFICKACGYMFQGRDCNKGLLEEINAGKLLLLQFYRLGPKCPKCGSRKTEENMFVCY